VGGVGGGKNMKEEIDENIMKEETVEKSTD
jgi:hypothetical protein